MRKHFTAVALEARSHELIESFTNELGNPIRLQVQERPIDGTQAASGKVMKNMPGVLIWLEGPHSVSENHITRMEAERLYQQLGRVLGHH